MQKAILWIVAIAALAFVGWWGFSQYLVSKLDGTGNPTRQTELTERYSSEEGLTFYYPDAYRLSSHSGGLEGGDTLVLLPKDYVAPQNGEGGPAIAIASYPNPNGLALEEWVRTDARSNFNLSPDQALAQTMVGGREAFAYRYSGLYENDAVAVEAKGRIFVFQVGWLDAEDQMRLDFSHILDSVEFE